MNLVAKVFIILLLSCHLTLAFGYWFTSNGQEKKKCSTVPSLSSRIGKVISQCQAEVKSDLIQDLLAPFNGHSFESSASNYDGLKDVSIDHHHHHSPSSGNIHLPSQHPFHVIPTDYSSLAVHLPTRIHHHPVHPHPVVNYHDHGAFPLSPDFHQTFQPPVLFDTHNFHAFAGQPIVQAPYSFHSYHEPHHQTLHHHEPSHHDPHYHENYHQDPHQHKLHYRDLRHHEHPDSYPQFSKPIHVVEAREELSRVLAVNMPKVINDNHDEISSVLEKLRNEKTASESQSNESSSSGIKMKRKKRSFSDLLKVKETNLASDILTANPTLNDEDRWLAGCLLHCVFKKSYALDNLGNPTVDGLTKLFTTGTTEQVFFLHVLRAVNQCVGISSGRNRIFRSEVQVRREKCDVAFDLFDCISDFVTEFC